MPQPVELSFYHRGATGRPMHNAVCVSVGEMDFFFSYQTLVGFAKPGLGRIVRDNVWGPTTGKHLNEIDHGRKSDRLSESDFARALADALSNTGLV